MNNGCGEKTATLRPPGLNSRGDPPLLKILTYFYVFPSQFAGFIAGRKCTCTSKSCKEAGVNTCRTKSFCYTELILTSDGNPGENTTTRGCTEGAPPLLCETKIWPRSKPGDLQNFPLLVLKCCDTHDYCNAGDLTSTKMAKDPEEDRQMDPSTPQSLGPLRGPPGPDLGHPTTAGRGHVDRGPPRETYESKSYAASLMRPLHVAAVVLALAALISVLAACYVITRFLRSYPYVGSSVE
ncbi:uncharacterized protein LOC105700768 [Orussus abietinus]|uniref:uncharacterized protein LOC105700768 n=1 Tax=Orussus abietinus TaxID=222816 RepID=UPI00062693B6|nr:uncharacterized protein LOC105700768 [Orussus abietinus]